jgi:hypothetical protein
MRQLLLKTLFLATASVLFLIFLVAEYLFLEPILIPHRIGDIRDQGGGLTFVGGGMAVMAFLSARWITRTLFKMMGRSGRGPTDQ